MSVFGPYRSWRVKCACGWAGYRKGQAYRGEPARRVVRQPCPRCGGNVEHAKQETGR